MRSRTLPVVMYQTAVAARGQRPDWCRRVAGRARGDRLAVLTSASIAANRRRIVTFHWQPIHGSAVAAKCGI